MEESLTGNGPDQDFRTMDGEHRLQIALLQAFRESVREGRDPVETARILEQVDEFTRAHFMSEQLLMRLYDYPQYQRHVAEHDRMVEDLEELGVQFRSGDHKLAAATAEALVAWLVGHIQRSDRDVAQYLGLISEGHNPGDPGAPFAR